MTALSLVIKIYKNPQWFKQECQNICHRLRWAFVAKPEETRLHVTYRITRNLIVTAVTLTLITFGCIALSYGAAGNFFVNSPLGVGVNPDFLKIVSSAGLVYLGHFLIGIFAFYKACKAYKHRQLLEASFLPCDRSYCLLCPLCHGISESIALAPY